jgi:hypothetical protein
VRKNDSYFQTIERFTYITALQMGIFPVPGMLITAREYIPVLQITATNPM